MQSRPAHDAVHQEGRARHVAHVFQQQNEQEQDQDLRQEHDHAADAGDDAVLDEALQQAGRQRVMRQRAEHVESSRDQIHHRLGPGKHRLEHHEQHAEQDREAVDWMQQHGVHARGHRVRPRRGADRGADDSIGFALGGAQLGRRRRLPGTAERAGEVRGHLVHAPHQFLGAAFTHGDRGDYRHAEFLR